MSLNTFNLTKSMNLKDLPSELTSLTTANGTEKSYFNKKVIKIAGTNAVDHKQEIYTMESLEVERIGNEKGHMIPYVNTACY